MLKRVTSLSLLSLLFLPLACSVGGDDNGSSFGSFSTTLPTTTATTMSMEEEDSGTSGDGDGDATTGDGDGDTTTGDGDGDSAGDGDGDSADTNDTSCPPGQFGCPCDNGVCEAGLSCVNGECQLGGGDGDGDTNGTTGGGNDPWDPDTCVDPSVPVTITGIEGSLCSAPCVSDLDCPAGPAGTNAACALVLDMEVDPSNCALICDPLNDACSPGASCKQVPNQPGVGICTYP